MYCGTVYYVLCTFVICTVVLCTVYCVLCRVGGSSMASMAQAISIVKTVWLSHTITKRPPTLILNWIPPTTNFVVFGGASEL